MENRTHPIRFRLGTTLLWDTAPSLLGLKHMKYNLILNKFLILFLEKYKSWYCIYYYSVFSKQPFFFYLFFYLKCYTNKRLKLFRAGSIFRKFRVNNKKQKIKKTPMGFSVGLIKKNLKRQFLWAGTSKQTDFMFSFFLLKWYLSCFFGVLKKKFF